MKKNLLKRFVVFFAVVMAIAIVAVPVYAQGINLEESEGFFLSGLDYDDTGALIEYYTDSANGTMYVMSQDDGLLYPSQESPRYTYHGYTMVDEKSAIDFFIDVTDGKLYVLNDSGLLTATDQVPQVSYDDVLEYVQNSMNTIVETDITTEEFLNNDGYDKYEPEYYCTDPETGLDYYTDENGGYYHYNSETGEYYEAESIPPDSAQIADDKNTVQNDTASEDICNVRVVEILSDQTKTDEYDGMARTQMLKVTVLDGKYKGKTLLMKYEMSNTMGNGAVSEPAQVGDKLIGYFVKDEVTGEISGIVTDYARTEKLIIPTIIFVLLLLLLGGTKGMRSLIALVITCLACIFLLIPAILHGWNPIVAAILAGIIAISVTLIIVYGFTMKTLAAAVGAFSGVLVAGILTAIMNKVMNMTGVVDCDSIDLAVINLPTLDLSDVLFATIVISALGGTIDVGISIASSLAELKEKAPKIKGAELFKSGINIGVDIMGASLNTLILSYVGGSLTVLLIVMYYSSLNNMTTLMNDEMIASELLQALVGSLGLLCTVPITSLVAAVMMCGKGNFGKITLDCFPALSKFCSFVGKGFNTVKNKVGELSTDKAKFEEPENLYEAAVRRSRELYRNAEEDQTSIQSEDGFDDI